MKIENIKIITSNEKKIRLHEQIIKEILGENFNLVYDFFCDVLEMKVQYKILHARRCQVLFKIFLPIILLNEADELNVFGEFISDHALPKYKKHILLTSGVIVDDILIHGRGLKTLYKALDKQFENDNLSIYICRKSQNATIEDNLQKKITCFSNAIDLEWRRLSCQFVNLIYASSSAYLSYLGSYHANDNCFKKDDFTNEFDAQGYTDFYRERQKATAYVLFERKTVPSLFRELGYDCGLRVYTSQKLNRTTCVPYVFLKNLNVKHMSELFKYVCHAINTDKITYIQNDLLLDSTDENIKIYQTKLFNAFINIIYGLYLKNQYNTPLNGAILDAQDLELCYGKDIAMELSALTYEDVRNLVTEDIKWQNPEYTISEDKELEDAFDSLSPGNTQDTDCLKNIIDKYFFKNGQLDEQSAWFGEERRKGLTLSKFYKNTEYKNRHPVSISQLYSWDSGIASCNIYVNNNIVASYVAAGEQSFRYVLEKHISTILDMIYAYNCPIWDATNESGEALADKIYQKYIKELESDTTIKDTDIEIFKDFIKTNKDTLGEWGIPEILTN